MAVDWVCREARRLCVSVMGRLEGAGRRAYGVLVGRVVQAQGKARGIKNWKIGKEVRGGSIKSRCAI